jgi:hypothetical protein
MKRKLKQLWSCIDGTDSRQNTPMQFTRYFLWTRWGKRFENGIPVSQKGGVVRVGFWQHHNLLVNNVILFSFKDKINQVYLPVHWSPVYPAGQMQINFTWSSKHRPPLKQGLLVQNPLHILIIYYNNDFNIEWKYSLLILLCVFTFWVPNCDVRYDFSIKTMFGSLIGGLMFYLRFLCLFAYSGAQHILCCVFALFFLRVVCPILPVSLDCQFLIAPSVFSNVCLIQYITLKWKNKYITLSEQF